MALENQTFYLGFLMVGTILDAILDFNIKKPDIQILFLNGQDSNEYLALVLNFRNRTIQNPIFNMFHSRSVGFQIPLLLENCKLITKMAEFQPW